MLRKTQKKKNRKEKVNEILIVKSEIIG